DLQTYLVELLMKQDQMSMAASIESRVPYLDHEFVEYATAIPGRFKLRGWRTKAVLRAALQDLVPREILTRPKMGFPVPVGRWLRGSFWPLVQEVVLGPRALRRGLVEPACVRRQAEAHRAGAVEPGDRLWRLLSLELWQRVLLDGGALAAPGRSLEVPRARARPGGLPAHRSGQRRCLRGGFSRRHAQCRAGRAGPGGPLRTQRGAHDLEASEPGRAADMATRASRIGV